MARLVISVWLGLLYLITFTIAQLQTDIDVSNVNEVIPTNILSQWQFKYDPNHIRIPITKMEDILNALPIKLQLIMSNEDFTKYGSEFQLFLSNTVRMGNEEVINLDYKFEQIASDHDDDSIQIKDIKIKWNQLINLDIDAFINREWNLLITYKSKYYVKWFKEYSVLFYQPSIPIIYESVPSYYQTQDYDGEIKELKR